MPWSYQRFPLPCRSDYFTPDVEHEDDEISDEMTLDFNDMPCCNDPVLGDSDLPCDRIKTCDDTKSSKPQKQKSSIRVLQHFPRKCSLSVSLNEEEKESCGKSSNLQEQVSLDMIKIWQQHIGNAKLSYISTALLKELQAVLACHFDGQIQQWQQYCQKIASSKFLMGEGKAWTFKGSVYLKWGIKTENIIKIQQDRISTGDRQLSLSDQELADGKRCAEIITSIQEIERVQETLHVEVNRTRRYAVQDQAEVILQGKDTYILEHYQQQFEHMIQAGDQDNPKWRYANCAPHFKDNITAWRTMDRTVGNTSNPWWHFKIYLTDLLATQHFGQDEPHMLKVRKQELEDHLKQLNEKLNEINQKRRLN